MELKKGDLVRPCDLRERDVFMIDGEIGDFFRVIAQTKVGVIAYNPVTWDYKLIHHDDPKELIYMGRMSRFRLFLIDLFS